MTNQTNSQREGFAARDLEGIALPFTTPFDEKGDVDLKSLRANIEKWNETGIGGYVALGSTGERAHLTESERRKVIEVSRESIPPGLAFIIGIGHQSTRVTVEEARHAAAASADAVLALTPHFYRTKITQETLVGHFLAVADASPVPVLLYSMPEFTGISLAPETVARLAEHKNIIGIKDSSGDIINLAEILRLAPEGFAVLTGNGASLYAALAAGAHGAVLAVGCVAPRQCVAIYDAMRALDHERALQLQRRLTPLARAVTSRYGIGGLKAALDLLGYAGGEPRAPLSPASTEARQEIARLLAQLDEDFTLADVLNRASA